MKRKIKNNLKKLIINILLISIVLVPIFSYGNFKINENGNFNSVETTNDFIKNHIRISNKLIDPLLPKKIKLRNNSKYYLNNVTFNIWKKDEKIGFINYPVSLRPYQSVEIPAYLNKEKLNFFDINFFTHLYLQLDLTKKEFSNNCFSKNALPNLIYANDISTTLVKQDLSIELNYVNIKNKLDKEIKFYDNSIFLRNEFIYPLGRGEVITIPPKTTKLVEYQFGVGEKNIFNLWGFVDAPYDPMFFGGFLVEEDSDAETK